MLIISRPVYSRSTTHVLNRRSHINAHPSNQGMVAAELEAAKSIKSLKAAIPKAEAYGIDTKAANKELIKVKEYLLLIVCFDYAIDA